MEDMRDKRYRANRAGKQMRVAAVAVVDEVKVDANKING